MSPAPTFKFSSPFDGIDEIIYYHSSSDQFRLNPTESTESDIITPPPTNSIGIQRTWRNHISSLLLLRPIIRRNHISSLLLQPILSESDGIIYHDSSSDQFRRNPMESTESYIMTPAPTNSVGIRRNRRNHNHYFFLGAEIGDFRGSMYVYPLGDLCSYIPWNMTF